MRRSVLFVAMFALTTSLPWFSGCGGSEETIAPEKLEESRQKLIDRTDRMRQDMQKKK